LAGKHLEELEPHVERKVKTLSDELRDVREEFISAYLRREVAEARERRYLFIQKHCFIFCFYRFALEELVRSRKDTGDTEPFTVGELSNYDAEDLEHHMRLFPADTKYFEAAYTVMASRIAKVKEQKQEKFILEDKDFEEVVEQREARPVEQQPWDDEFTKLFGEEEEEGAAKKVTEKEQGEIEGTYEPTDVPKEEEK
jgi:hypothetical protein